VGKRKETTREKEMDYKKDNPKELQYMVDKEQNVE